MSSDNAYVLLPAAYAVLIKKKRNQLSLRPQMRRKWVKQWLLKRSKYTHTNSLEELRLEPDDWRNYLRMDENSYATLLKLVSPLIEKEDTILRAAISPHARLTATLRLRRFKILNADFSSITGKNNTGNLQSYIQSAEDRIYEGKKMCMYIFY
ncbi:hypothetical protein QE152_g31374 [Popillia japonica]|uniref:Uncharacterized protein n=1 Tax=Popillia japonica TaxID=7064 RepID=A0AAW1J1W7_POPJA